MIERRLIEGIGSAIPGLSEELQGEILQRILGSPESGDLRSRLETAALESEWQKQANRYLELYFHGELYYEDCQEDMEKAREAYLASLPKLGPQPEAFKGRFDIPILVDPRIPIEVQAVRAELAEYSKFNYHWFAY